MGTNWTADRRILAAGTVAAVVVGFSVAAAVDALAAPDVAVADGYGPGDGLTRWVLGTADPATLVTAAATAPGVVNAQPLFDGGVLVATTSADPAGLAGLPGVVSVEPSVSVPVLGDPTDPYWSRYGYNLENTGSNSYDQPGVRDADVDATAGWAATTGTGQVVAVIDTGYDLDHEDMADAVWTNPREACGSVDTNLNGKAGDCHGWDFTRNSPIVDADVNGSHGVSVSGVIAARKDNGLGSAGVAPGVSIMPLVIGSGESVDVNLGAQAIRYAVDNGATVINASWGGAFTGSALAALQSAVAYAGAHDVLVVAAAGNDAADRDTNALYPASLSDPAIVTVGSSTASDTLSTSSAYGANSVDLVAPGNLVFTTWFDGGYRLVSGTSIAAPEVAAVVAQYRSLMPTATGAQLKQALLADVDPLPAFAGKTVTGGRLTTDGLAALGSQDVRWTYTGMTGAPGTLTPAVTTSTSLPAGAYTAVVGLGMRVGGQTYAVSGQTLTVNGSTLTTDDTGTVAVPLGTRGPASGALVLTPSTALTEGRYVLTVQLLQDGDPLGRTSAAPLTVTSPSAAPTTGAGPTGAAPTGGSAAPTGTPGSSSTPAGPGGSGGAGGPGNGGSTPSSSTTAPSTTAAPTTAAPTTAAPTTGAAPSSTTMPTSTAAPTSTPARTTTPAATTAPTSGAGGGPGAGGVPSVSASPTAAPTASPTTTPAATSTAPTTAPPTGSTSYPGTGDFRVTSVAPSQVSTAGGALVTVTGTFPTEPRVLVGNTQTASVVSASATQVVFTAPARIAGTYDLLLSTTDGKRSLLSNALVYVDPAGGGGTPTPTATPTGAAPTVAVPPTVSTPAGPVVIIGPAGQRLVQTAFFSALPAAVWTTDCSTSCSGVLV